MDKNINLDSLKDEIKRRKTERQDIGIDTQGVGALPPKDKFLNGLLESLNSGRETHASKLVKMVDNKVAEKNGEKTRHKINEELVDNSPPIDFENSSREQSLYDEIAKKTQQMISKNKYPENSALLTSNPQQPITLNEEVIKKVITDNFEHLIENALKNSIVNIFMSERIKEVINENEDIVKNVVIKTLKELYKKKKT